MLLLLLLLPLLLLLTLPLLALMLRLLRLLRVSLLLLVVKLLALLRDPALPVLGHNVLPICQQYQALRWPGKVAHRQLGERRRIQERGN